MTTAFIDTLDASEKSDYLINPFSIKWEIEKEYYDIFEVRISFYNSDFRHRTDYNGADILAYNKKTYITCNITKDDFENLYYQDKRSKKYKSEFKTAILNITNIIQNSYIFSKYQLTFAILYGLTHTNSKKGKRYDGSITLRPYYDIGNDDDIIIDNNSNSNKEQTKID
tara:strand:- start:7325 stop:7831 length:507 start_codon:yes stop_codon:yes gene_type:complete